MRTSFTISLIVRKGCVAGTRASRSTYENSDPDVLSDPRMLASIALEAQTESYSSARVSTRVSRREFQQPANAQLSEVTRDIRQQDPQLPPTAAPDRDLGLARRWAARTD